MGRFHGLGVPKWWKSHTLNSSNQTRLRLHNVRLSNSTVSLVLLKSSMSPSDSMGFFHVKHLQQNILQYIISLSSSIHGGLSVSLPLTVNRKYQYLIRIPLRDSIHWSIAGSPHSLRCEYVLLWAVRLIIARISKLVAISCLDMVALRMMPNLIRHTQHWFEISV